MQTNHYRLFYIMIGLHFIAMYSLMYAGAILMCQQASIEDQEIQVLCKNIIAGQQSEIDQEGKARSIRKVEYPLDSVADYRV
jgi:hypothetical protein